MRLLFAMLAAAVVAAATVAGAAEQVEIPHGEATLPGILYRPEGPGPFPGVIALHGCSGLMSRAGTIHRGLADWGDRLAAAGVAVLFLDSFSTRGLTAQCSMRVLKVRPARERVADANAALRWMQEQSWAQKDRISLMGWSEGAMASLWAVRRRGARRDEVPDFRSAIAFYPGCRGLGARAWAARVPTLILIGRADDLTPAAACEQMVADARGRTAHTAIVVYPGAYHFFDRPNFPVRVVTGILRSADGSGNAHFGTDDAARADALKRVPEWLTR
jgi:dienelactone hydrolase